MFKLLFNKYWQFGFKTRLYDLLSPEEYFMSLQRASDLLNIDENSVLLDAGCGSGLMLRFVKEKLRAGMTYVGADYLFSGLSALKGKASELDAGSRVSCFQADLTKEVSSARFQNTGLSPQGDLIKGVKETIDLLATANSRTQVN